MINMGPWRCAAASRPLRTWRNPTAAPPRSPGRELVPPEQLPVVVPDCTIEGGSRWPSLTRVRRRASPIEPVASGVRPVESGAMSRPTSSRSSATSVTSGRSATTTSTIPTSTGRGRRADGVRAVRLLRSRPAVRGAQPRVPPGLTCAQGALLARCGRPSGVVASSRARRSRSTPTATATTSPCAGTCSPPTARRRWNKLLLAAELLGRYDLVLWVDADAAIVDPTVDIADELGRRRSHGRGRARVRRPA